MGDKHVDARGMACPQPVVLTRREMLDVGVDRVCVVVDSEVSAENIQRMARTLGWELRVERQGGEIRIELTRGEAAADQVALEPQTQLAPVPRQLQVVVLVTSNLFGTGDEKLGAILMKAFLKTLREVQPQPTKVIFVNAGVRLTTEGSDLIETLAALDEAGVAILSCGTCLDFYGLKQALRVGVASNMFEIATSLVTADRVVHP